MQKNVTTRMSFIVSEYINSLFGRKHSFRPIVYHLPLFFSRPVTLLVRKFLSSICHPKFSTRFLASVFDRKLASEWHEIQPISGQKYDLFSRLKKTNKIRCTNRSRLSWPGPGRALWLQSTFDLVFLLFAPQGSLNKRVVAYSNGILQQNCI